MYYLPLYISMRKKSFAPSFSLSLFFLRHFHGSSNTIRSSTKHWKCWSFCLCYIYCSSHKTISKMRSVISSSYFFLHRVKSISLYENYTFYAYMIWMPATNMIFIFSSRCQRRRTAFGKTLNIFHRFLHLTKIGVNNIIRKLLLLTFHSIIIFGNCIFQN